MLVNGIAQTSGSTVNGFTLPVVYTVIAANGSSQNYTITVLPTYIVTYNANGASSGTVPVDTNWYTNGQFVTILSNTGLVSMPNYTFSGWNSSNNGCGCSYHCGNCFTKCDMNETLFAYWLSQNEALISFGFQMSCECRSFNKCYRGNQRNKYNDYFAPECKY